MNEFQIDKKIEVKVDNFTENHSGYVIVVLYFPEINRIVSSSNDNTIRVWNPVTLKCSEVVKRHTNSVKSIMKWSSSEFFSCGFDGMIFNHFIKRNTSLLSDNDYGVYKGDFELNLDDPENRIFLNENVRSGRIWTERLMKLTDDLFLCFVNVLNGILIISRMKNTILRKLNRENVHCHPLPILSIIHSNCFYYGNVGFGNIKDKDCRQNCIDFMNDRIIKTFHGEIKEVMYTSTVYLNKDEEEIFAIAGRCSFVYFYNTSKDWKIFKTVTLNLGRVMSMFLFKENDQLLLIASPISKKTVSIINIKDDFKVVCDWTKKGKKGIISFALKDFSLERNEIEIVCGGFSNEVSILKISGALKDQGKKDLLERKDFLEFICSCSDDSCTSCIGLFAVKFYGGDDFLMFKSFLI